MKTYFVALIAAILIALPGCTDIITSPVTPYDDGSTIAPPVTGPNSSTGSGTVLFVLHDSTGESNGPADVQGVLMVFDKGTGQYAIYIVATPEDPFPASQMFRININLFNVDLGTRAKFPSFFSCTMNDYALGRSETMIVLRGTDPSLIYWRESNRVLTNSLKGTANPEDVTLFRSAVGDALVGISPDDKRLGFLDAEDTIADGPWPIAVKLQKSTTGGLTASSALDERAVRQILWP